MSFDLFVYGGALDAESRDEARAHFYRLFSQAGLRAQWHPDFDVTADYASASVPFRIEIDPEYVPEWQGYGTATLLSAVNLTRRRNDRFDAVRRAPWSHKAKLFGAAWEYALTTSAGRNPLDFRLQVTFAACLCMAADGIVLDPQDERGWFSRGDAMKHLFMQARACDVMQARENPEDWNLPRFTGWPALELS